MGLDCTAWAFEQGGEVIAVHVFDEVLDRRRGIRCLVVFCKRSHVMRWSYIAMYSHPATWYTHCTYTCICLVLIWSKPDLPNSDGPVCGSPPRRRGHLDTNLSPCADVTNAMAIRAGWTVGGQTTGQR